MSDHSKDSCRAVDFNKISLTAKLTAYMRQFSDIPFAAEVALHLGAHKVFADLLADNQLNPEDLTWYAPLLEVRYKSIANLLLRVSAGQVMELASGFSLRGLAMSQDSNIHYIETDLAELTNEKKALVNLISAEHELPAAANFKIAAVNALDLAQLVNVSREFIANQELYIISEGLLQYLSADELACVSSNIGRLLQMFGGAWITSDFSLKDQVATVTEQQKKFRKLVSGAMDRPLYGNAFDDRQQLSAFLAKFDLEYKEYGQLDLVDELSALKNLDLAPGVLDDIKPQLRLYAVTIRNSPRSTSPNECAKAEPTEIG